MGQRQRKGQRQRQGQGAGKRDDDNGWKSGKMFNYVLVILVDVHVNLHIKRMSMTTNFIIF